MRDADLGQALQQQVQHALQNNTPLNICGGNSKTFLGRTPFGQPLDVSGHRGIINYDPRELVITARAGTPLNEIEATLAAAGQMLAFEPPHFGTSATLGGTIACGLSGARRPYAGSARDFTLGCRLLNGRGETLQFGGQVMKNVAGYDVSRLLVGAFGTLGVLLDISLKVLPRPAASLTLSFECDASTAITYMSELLIRPYPVDAACHDGERCHVRISGSVQAVKEARNKIRGEELPRADAFWQGLREHELPCFNLGSSLYRIMVKPSTPPLAIAGTWLLDWGGGQRWIISDEPLAAVRAHVAQVGGYVTQFRGGDRDGLIFAPLDAPLFTLHQRLKNSFDPHGIFNRGRIYSDF